MDKKIKDYETEQNNKFLIIKEDYDNKLNVFQKILNKSNCILENNKKVTKDMVPIIENFITNNKLKTTENTITFSIKLVENENDLIHRNS